MQQDKSVYSHIQKLVDCLSNEDAAEPQYLPAKAAPSLITATPILLNRVDFNDKVCMGSDPKTQGTLVVVNDALVTGDAAHGWCSLIGYESVAAINSNNFFDARRVLDSCNVDRVYILGKQFNTGNCRTIAQDGTLGVVPCTEALPVLCMNKSPIVKPIFQSSLISHKFVVNHRALCHSDRPKSPFSVIVSGVAKITSLSSTSKEISTATFKGIESLSVTLEECESGAPTCKIFMDWWWWSSSIFL